MLPRFVINDVIAPVSEVDELCEASVESISLVLKSLARLSSVSPNPWLVQAAVDLACAKYVKELDEVCHSLVHELEKTEKALSRKLCHPTATLRQDEPTTALGWYAKCLVAQWRQTLRDVAKSHDAELFAKSTEAIRKHKMAWIKEHGTCK
ncbi:hypothetical protein GNI_067280 [Gregarina niphandrodes]|uniref:Uncharacterized protein n=1 Tax=Gregarina niphandrodes TaxID=110365 RepID=A0A023B7Q4_GRENI|nr:hypothetical protein GNI_067280 [Gregarina niphandrodes]EZG67632.1 hypothetical protein GNI_067280 [Gregarina niphandrodes]|eukprot:XP_011130185.1 hypothetical protein GNI_067280 [Gregarina niphandrodes]